MDTPLLHCPMYACKLLKGTEAKKKQKKNNYNRLRVETCS